MLKEKSEHNGSVFLVVKHNTICQESKEAREGWKEISVYNPSTKQEQPKWIYPYDSVTGYLDKIEWYDRRDETIKKRFLGFKLHISDNGELVTLDLPFRTTAYRVFTKIAENLDYGQPVEFSAWYSRKDDGTAFAAKQGDVWIKHRYTKANLGDCPPPVENELEGKWDYSAQEVWLKEKIMAEVAPIAEQWATYRTTQAPVTKPQPAPAQEAPPSGVNDQRIIEHKAAMSAQAPRGPAQQPKRQGPPAPPSDPYEGGTFNDEFVPF